MARLEIFLKYASNILKFKNFPKHGEAREPFKNIFCILIKKVYSLKRFVGETVDIRHSFLFPFQYLPEDHFQGKADYVWNTSKTCLPYQES